MVRFLIEKEFRQISRNPILPRLILVFPVVVLLVFPWAANFEIKNLNLHVVDHDQTTWSRQLTEKAVSSGYFRLSGTSFDYNQALADIESDDADIILEIPAGFEATLIREHAAKVMISANAVNGTKGGMGSAYLSAIVQEFGKEVSSDVLFTARQTPMPVIEIIPYNRYNPRMDYKIFMVPALVVMLLTMLCGFLPALNIVAEKEAGTMEQINVTPVSRFTFIISKLLPYWLIGMTVLTITFGVAYLVYGLVPVGSLWTIYFFAIMYILTVSGAGLIISNYSETMQQAMFVIYFFMLILIILSGLFTPVNSMPEWAQFITRFNPLKYFMQVMRMVYLKGSTFSDLHTQFFALLSFAAVFNTWAVWSYRKRV